MVKAPCFYRKKTLLYVVLSTYLRWIGWVGHFSVKWCPVELCIWASRVVKKVLKVISTAIVQSTCVEFSVVDLYRQNVAVNPEMQELFHHWLEGFIKEVFRNKKTPKFYVLHHQMAQQQQLWMKKVKKKRGKASSCFWRIDKKKNQSSTAMIKKKLGGIWFLLSCPMGASSPDLRKSEGKNHKKWENSSRISVVKALCRFKPKCGPA